MPAKNPKRVCGGYKTAAGKKIREAEEYVGVTDRIYSDLEEQEILGMISDLKIQMTRWETDFQSTLSHELEDADHETYEKELSDHQDLSKKAISALKVYLENLRTKVIVDPTRPLAAAATGNANASANQSPKIDDTLKPEKLLRSYTLEEFNAWSEKFQAYYDHNKKTLDKSITISRQILNNLLDLKLLNALKTEEGVKDDTPILANGGCLSKLKDIFLKESPLFVRRYNFLKHVQDPRQPFGDWWVTKKSKDRECELDRITKEDMMLLSLMTGVHDPRLKEQFLRQENPTTEALVKIAESWQRAERISRDMASGGATVNLTKSGYQRGREENWNRRHGRSKSRGPEGPKGPNQNQKPLCKACGDTRCKGGKDCFAKGKKCNICSKVGHYGRVCRDKDKASQETPGSGKSAKSNKVRVRKTQNSQSSDYALDDNEPIPTAKMVFTPLPNGQPFDIIVFSRSRKFTVHHLVRHSEPIWSTHRPPE